MCFAGASCTELGTCTMLRGHWAGTMQASVRAVGTQQASNSQWQTVHLAAPGEVLPPEPLKLELLEWLVLRMPWPTFAYG